MLPPNKILVLLFEFLRDFILDRSIALAILFILIVWCLFLKKEFSGRVDRYTDKNPPEKYWLMLQCGRWTTYMKQVLGALYLTIGFAFLLFVLFSMFGEIITESGEDYSVYFKYLQILIFVSLVAYKIRAITDANGVYKDLKKAEL